MKDSLLWLSNFLFFPHELFPPMCFFLYFFELRTFHGLLKLNEMKGISLKGLQLVVLLNEHMGHLVCDVVVVKDVCMLEG